MHSAAMFESFRAETAGPGRPVTLNAPLTLELITRLVEGLAQAGALRGREARAEIQRLIAVLRRHCADR